MGDFKHPDFSKNTHVVRYIDRAKIEKAILENLDQYENWRDNNVGRWSSDPDPTDALKSLTIAKYLIELLEGLDCGSQGGYGYDVAKEISQHIYKEFHNTLRGRYRWLKGERPEPKQFDDPESRSNYDETE